MRMGRVSWLTRRRVPPVTHTHALFADQSHSIPDNLMALLGAVRAWHCSGKAARVPVAHWCTAGFGFQARHALLADDDGQLALVVEIARDPRAHHRLVMRDKSVDQPQEDLWVFRRHLAILPASGRSS